MATSAGTWTTMVAADTALKQPGASVRGPGIELVIDPAGSGTSTTPFGSRRSAGCRTWAESESRA